MGLCDSVMHVIWSDYVATYKTISVQPMRPCITELAIATLLGIGLYH